MPQEQQSPEARSRGPSPFLIFRLIKWGRAAGAVVGFFANPASAAIWVPVGLFVLALFIILFATGAAPPMGIGVTPPPLPPGMIASCPVPDGTISTHSFKGDPLNGHCGTRYLAAGFTCPTLNPTETRRAKSIDVKTGGKDVVLPTIQGQALQWRYLQLFLIDPQDCEEKAADGSCGIGLAFQADLGNGGNWTLHFIHMQGTTLAPGNSYPSGTPVGKTAISHVHITIGKDVKDIMVQLDPGWKPAEELGMCVK